MKSYTDISLALLRHSLFIDLILLERGQKAFSASGIYSAYKSFRPRS